MRARLDSAARHLGAIELAPSTETSAELLADKGYHSRETLKALDDGQWKTRIAEPKRDGFLRWNGDDAARRAVVNNRVRLLSRVALAAFKLRPEIVKCFARVLDRGGMRRSWLRGQENIHKRYLIHVAGYSLGLMMRLLTGAGTPRAFQLRLSAMTAPAFSAELPDVIGSQARCMQYVALRVQLVALFRRRQRQVTLLSWARFSWGPGPESAGTAGDAARGADRGRWWGWRRTRLEPTRPAAIGPAAC